MICLNEFLPGIRRRYRSYHLLLGRAIARPISNNSSCVLIDETYFHFWSIFKPYVPILDILDLFQTYFEYVICLMVLMDESSFWLLSHLHFRT